jgi:FG-GAP repeat
MKHFIKLLPVLIALSSLSAVQAQPDLSELKLQGRWPTGATAINADQGYAVALSEKWAISGAPFATPGLVDGEGVVQVFNAVTGVWVRTLRRPATPVEAGKLHFGQALAISGDLAVICADGDTGDVGGATWAYVYNLATGALVRTIKPSYANSGVGFGRSVAISGNRVLIGSPDKGSGAVDLFDLATGVQQTEFFGSDAATNPFMQFGTSVAIEGNFALIGAPGRTFGRGGAYVIDLTTFAELAIIVPTGSDASGGVGSSVALSQGIALMAAPLFGGTKGAVFSYDIRTQAQGMLTTNINGDYFGKSHPGTGVVASNGVIAVGISYASGHAGAVRVYDLHTLLPLRTITPTDGGSGFFGNALAMSGNTLLVGRFYDPSPVLGVGSAYLFKPITTAMPVVKVAAKSDFAPGAAESTLSVLGDAFINSEGEVAFQAKTAGAGSHGGTDTGMWSTLAASGHLDLSGMSFSAVGAMQIASVGTALINQAGTALYPATLKSGVGGVTALTNKAIIAESGNAATVMLQTGGDLPFYSSATLLGLGELVQSNNSGADQDRWAIGFTLKPDAITAASNDTGVYVRNMNGSAVGHREGGSSPAADGAHYGQFTGRIAFGAKHLVFAAALDGLPATNAMLVRRDSAGVVTQVARKGGVAPIFGIDAVFSAFLGEMIDGADSVLLRTSISGVGVTTTNNEALFTSNDNNALQEVLVKGHTSGLPSGTSVAKIIHFWCVGPVPKESRTLALVQLKGVGVTTVNDQALVMLSAGNLNILVREGQAAQGCHPATIGTISRVEVDPYAGGYAVLTTLAGAAATSNQALFTGRAGAGNLNDLLTLCRPELFLRKGQLYDNQPSPIKSLSLPTTNITASGAGGTGRGRAISWNGRMVITVEFANGVRQIMKGSL